PVTSTPSLHDALPISAILLPALFSLLILFACRKDSFITGPDAIVRVTADTLKYDTVFTQTGSVTQSFKIVNENDKKLRLSSVKLDRKSTRLNSSHVKI